MSDCRGCKERDLLLRWIHNQANEMSANGSPPEVLAFVRRLVIVCQSFASSPPTSDSPPTQTDQGESTSSQSSAAGSVQNVATGGTVPECQLSQGTPLDAGGEESDEEGCDTTVIHRPKLSSGQLVTNLDPLAVGNADDDTKLMGPPAAPPNIYRQVTKKRRDGGRHQEGADPRVPGDAMDHRIPRGHTLPLVLHQDKWVAHWDSCSFLSTSTTARSSTASSTPTVTGRRRSSASLQDVTVKPESSIAGSGWTESGGSETAAGDETITNVDTSPSPDRYRNVTRRRVPANTGKSSRYVDCDDDDVDDEDTLLLRIGRKSPPLRRRPDIEKTDQPDQLDIEKILEDPALQALKALMGAKPVSPESPPVGWRRKRAARIVESDGSDESRIETNEAKRRKTFDEAEDEHDEMCVDLRRVVARDLGQELDSPSDTSFNVDKLLESNSLPSIKALLDRRSLWKEDTAGTTTSKRRAPLSLSLSISDVTTVKFIPPRANQQQVPGREESANGLDRSLSDMTTVKVNNLDLRHLANARGQVFQKPS